MTVVDGAAIWSLHATHGFPIEFSLAALADRNAVPSWDRLMNAARADGVHMIRFMRRLEEAIMDAYPPDISRMIYARLRSFQ